MIEAKIVCDSLNSAGVRLTTFVLTYPRFIHAEFMTHRMFSRNASSSRAIPVKKQIQMVIDNPVIPLAFTKNQKGMQGGEALSGEEHDQAVKAWLLARDKAVEMAGILAGLEVHKQYANRILEPFAHITVVCTATEYANFFALRIHSAAQPEIKDLADKMYSELQSNKPNKLISGEWHLPFISDREKSIFLEPKRSVDDLLKMSVARCARVSYLNHEGKEPSLVEDLSLYARLVGAAPIHASPAEHQAQACSYDNMFHGNFRGWSQYRKCLSNENVEKFDPTT